MFVIGQECHGQQNHFDLGNLIQFSLLPMKMKTNK